MGPSRITKSSIQETLDRIDAIAVVEDFIRLEKRGGRFWGRCPFHSGGQEKTPSFTVNPDQKLYYCFGCHKGGSIIDFVMEMDKLSFPEAIKHLARKFGVELNYEGGGESDDDWKAEQSRKEQLYELYRRTAFSFSHFLMEKPEGKPFLDYLLSRGISREMIERFRLGYSPADRKWLYGFLQGKGYSPEFLDNSGLFSANYRETAFFSDRLMFPITNRHGQVSAFGGRARPDAVQADGTPSPKYINTREIDTYKKGEVLFALDLALPEIRRTKTVYLAEGYMDVIALHQAGVGNAVAPCGTAFTDEQVKYLRTLADNAVLVFDSDEAGRKAAAKGIIACRQNGLICSLVVPGTVDGEDLKDPAEILQKFGADTLNKSMKNAIIDVEYLIVRSKELYDTSKPQGRAGAIATLYPYFDALASKTERDDCIQLAVDTLRAERAAVVADYEHWHLTARKWSDKKPDFKEVPSSTQADASAFGGLPVKAGTELPIRMNDELFLLTVVSVNTYLYPEFRAAVEMRSIENPVAKELFIALEESFRNEDMDFFMSRINSPVLRNYMNERVISGEFRGDSKRDPRKLMEDGIRRVKVKNLRRRLVEIGAEMRLMERNSGQDFMSVHTGDNFQDLIDEKMRIDTEICKLEGKTG